MDRRVEHVKTDQEEERLLAVKATTSSPAIPSVNPFHENRMRAKKQS